MIDTIVASVWNIPFSPIDFEKDFLQNLNKKYRVERKAIPFYSAKKGGHAYQLLLKIISLEWPKTYLLIKLKPRVDLKGIPILKFKTELPLFRNAFWTEVKRLSSSKFWGFVLANHELSVLHVKCDFSLLKFNEFRLCLDSSSPRNPRLLTNPETLRRTLYVSPNHYYYEKTPKVRGEIRLNNTKAIKAKLGVTSIFQLKDINVHHYIALFKGIKFTDPYSLKRTKGKKQHEDYKYFLKLLNDQNNKPVRTKRGQFFESNNFFMGAKRILGQKPFKHIGTQLSYRNDIKTIFYSQLRKEYEIFNRRKYE